MMTGEPILDACYERGDADAYYGRGPCPHYWTGYHKYQGEEITEENMTEEQVAAYMRGYNENPCGRKDWG